MKKITCFTQQLILGLINPNAQKKEINRLISNKIDWKYFHKISFTHRIAPLTYYNLKKFNLLYFVPDEIINALKMAFIYTSRTNIMLSEELKNILNKFHERGISCIILKGFAFIETIYKENPGVRPLKDIDLLIKEENLKEASQILYDTGYEFYRDYRSEDYYRQSHFHFPFKKKGEIINTFLEIHWHLLCPNIPVDLDIETLWEKSIDIDYHGQKANILCTEDALIYLIWHTALNGFDELLKIADILYLIDYQKPSWRKIISQIKDAQLDIPFYWESYIISELFDSKLIPAIEIDTLSTIFTKSFFTKKNMMEQFILSDWPISNLMYIFMYKSKLYGINQIFNQLPSFPRNIKVMAHYLYCLFEILFIFIKTKIDEK